VTVNLFNYKRQSKELASIPGCHDLSNGYLFLGDLVSISLDDYSSKLSGFSPELLTEFISPRIKNIYTII
jgi:hypothetical protein